MFLGGVLVVADQADRVVCGETADGTAGLDQHDDGPVRSQDEPRRVEVGRR